MPKCGPVAATVGDESKAEAYTRAVLYTRAISERCRDKGLGLYKFTCLLYFRPTLILSVEQIILLAYAPHYTVSQKN